jgi:hypothetical protein
MIQGENNNLLESLKKWYLEQYNFFGEFFERSRMFSYFLMIILNF